MKASRLAALALLVLPLLAQGQDARRRPGEGADRDATSQAAPKKKKKKPAPAAAETAPAENGAAAAPATTTAEAPPTEPAVAPAEAPASRARPGRRRPGQPDYTRPTAEGERVAPGTPPRPAAPFNPNRRSGLAAVPHPPGDAAYAKTVVPDRWQLTRQLGLTDYPWYDPYHQNTLKADRPVFGKWFFNLALVSDTVLEPRRFPLPVAPQGEAGPGSQDQIGDGEQTIFEQNLATAFVLYKGNTTFMPPDWEFRFTPVFNFNRAEVEQARVLRIDPAEGTTRNDDHVGVQELFVDKHLWDVSPRYDFDSLRLGIQPFNADFRGFLFRDAQLGARLFGNRANNRYQYNVAWFRRIEKDTNSGLNDLGAPLRADDVIVANVFAQDLLWLGFTVEGIALYNRNDEGDDAPYYNTNGFIERPASLGREAPRNYEVLYLGGAGEGHAGPLNVSATAYAALGEQDASVFVEHGTDISAFFVATELSMDFDWRRVRLSGLYASGDDDPYDDVDTGFDAVTENPLFAGADTSFWIRQNVPLIGGGGVAISGRNGVLNSLRSSKDQGQANFTNPGTVLLGLGADLDLTPRWRVSTNVNQLWFATTEVIEVARAQAGVPADIGIDVSLATVWRPLFIQNVVLRASAAALLPGKGYEALYGDETPYSVLLNLILTY